MVQREHEAAVRWLERGWNIDRRIRVKERRLRELRDRMSSLRISRVTGMPRGGRAADWTQAADAAGDLERELLRDISELCEVRREIKAFIDGVELVLYRELLEYRYLHCMTWPEVAEAMQKNDRYIYKLHRKVLEEVGAALRAKGRWEAGVGG